MYRSMYVAYSCLCIYEFMFNVCINVCMCICLFLWVLCLYVCMSVNICAYVCMYLCMYLHIYICIWSHWEKINRLALTDNFTSTISDSKRHRAHGKPRSLLAGQFYFSGTGTCGVDKGHIHQYNLLSVKNKLPLSKIYIEVQWIPHLKGFLKTMLQFSMNFIIFLWVYLLSYQYFMEMSFSNT